MNKEREMRDKFEKIKIGVKKDRKAEGQRNPS